MQWTVGTCSHVTKKQGLNKTSLLTSVNIAGKYCTTCCLAEEFQSYTDTKLIHFHSKKKQSRSFSAPTEMVISHTKHNTNTLEGGTGKEDTTVIEKRNKETMSSVHSLLCNRLSVGNNEAIFKLNILNDVIWQGHKVGIGKKIIKTWGKTSDTAEIMNRDSFNTWLTCLWGSL